MNKQFTICGYNITSNPDFQNEKFGNTPALIAQLESLHFDAANPKNNKIIAKLLDLIIQYPSSPQLKNFLSLAYAIRNNFSKAEEVNNWIRVEHPDYIFGILNEGYSFLAKEEYLTMQELLGEAMELKQLFPKRDLFHLAEVTAFYKLTVLYFVGTENLELAENRLEILQQIAPDHKDTVDAELIVASFRTDMENNDDIWYDNDGKIGKSILSKKPPSSTTILPPQFNHPEIQDLYQFGVGIAKERLKKITSLPRQTLIEDLEKVLLDAVKRYPYFIEEMNYDEERCGLVLHTFMLLKEIKAEDSLGQVLAFLEYDYDFLDFWLGDHQTETIWQCIFVLGLNKIDTLKLFLLKPGIDTYSKTSVSGALSQIALHFPEKRSAVEAAFSEIFTSFLEAKIEENLIDPSCIALMICDAGDCNLNELLPKIRLLYQKGYVNESICGNYDTIVEFFNERNRDVSFKKIETMEAIYDCILTSWDLSHDYSELFELKQDPIILIKINRNDPCPCGSGKKYKNCCIK